MSIIQYVSASFAIAAALLWFKSAIVRTPESFSIHVARSDSFDGSMMRGSVLGGQYVGHGYSNELNELANALRQQSRWSAWAAVCAGISAVLQATTLLA